MSINLMSVICQNYENYVLDIEYLTEIGEELPNEMRDSV